MFTTQPTGNEPYSHKRISVAFCAKLRVWVLWVSDLRLISFPELQRRCCWLRSKPITHQGMTAPQKMKTAAKIKRRSLQQKRRIKTALRVKVGVVLGNKVSFKMKEGLLKITRADGAFMKWSKEACVKADSVCWSHLAVA